MEQRTTHSRARRSFSEGTYRKTRETSPEPDASTGHNGELRTVFLEELADMLHAEYQLTKALPKLIRAAEEPKLAEAIQDHLTETQEHIHRIEQVFEALGEKSRRKRCEGMEGVLTEGEEMVKEQRKTSAIDATIIASSQKVEHYEIASYGTLVAWARLLDQEDAVELLEQTLEEEKAADKKLTEIALSLANIKAE